MGDVVEERAVVGADDGFGNVSAGDWDSSVEYNVHANARAWIGVARGRATAPSAS